MAPGPVPPGPLAYAVHLAGGVRIEVDLAAPGRWRAVTAPRGDATVDLLLRSVVGDNETLRSPLPWLRVAVADALDRWLQIPLRQSLVDAERGIARGRAARALPNSPVRAVLVGDALQLARRSSRDLVSVLRRLGRAASPVPSALCAALKNVVDGYAELSDEVTGPDGELLAVLEGWRRLIRQSTGATPSAPAFPENPTPPVRGPVRAAHAIDPRQVHARVLALADDPATREITLVRTNGDDVVVRVAAFGPGVPPDLAARLLVRIVDRRSGEAKGHALLRASRTGYFEATVPLYGLDLADVRVDVADALSDLPPAADDADEGLCEARRAVVFLAEWRRLVVLAQLGVATAGPALRLRDLATRLQPGRARAELPLFTNGPSSAELTALADLGDDELTCRLRGDGPLSEGLRSLTAGPAALLVAELAALVLPPAA